MIQLKHVMVGTDFSEPAGVALDYGRELCRSFGATLHVVHAVDMLSARLPMTHGHGQDIDIIQKNVEEAGREALGRLVTDEDRSRFNAQSAVVADLAPWDALLAYARDKSIDLVVIGTHGRSALSRLMMGSVAERLVRSSPCPVLTVRHPEHGFIRPDALEKTKR